jgi:uncharacterized membrane protein
MEEFLLFVILVVLAIRWWVLSRRYSAMERRIEAILSRDQVDPKLVGQLTQRIYQLESALARLKTEPSGAVLEAPVVEPAPAPKIEVKPQPMPEPVPVSAPPSPFPMTVAPEPAKVAVEAAEALALSGAGDSPALARFREAEGWQPAPPAAQPLPREVPPQQPSEPEPPRPSRSSEEWEALVGGNWLNKLGILVLVIAIALFLGYSFTQLGPPGRSAIALVVSFALLIGGVVLERRPRYVIFARGLLAGGWAALYFTTYAMQAVDAAKVISSPLLGGLLLLAVATAMVVHSLRYRVQALTGLAYFMAFATLAITPVTTLSVIALVPLAASLLVIANRFSWSGLVLFGLVATYGTCASKGDNGAPLWSAQTVFAIYWLLFEAYDILRAHRRSDLAAEWPILALNALGFGGLSYAKWSAAAPEQIYMLASGMAAAYLASTILRAMLRPPASFAADATTMDRILAGGYEGPITLAAAFSVVAAALKLHGQTVNTVLLVEGELLFLGGLIFKQNYPRRLAGAVFGGLGLKLLNMDLSEAGTVRLAGRTLRDWTPTAAFAVLLFYINRGLRKSGKTYGYAASALVALVIGFEISILHLGLTWLGFAALLFLFGWRFRLFDFRLQGYIAGTLAIGAVWVHQIEISAGTALPWAHPWIPLAATAVMAYGAAMCALRSAPDRFTETERPVLQAIACAAASAASAALLWRIVPAVYLGPVWIALGILALELGLRRLPSDLRAHSYILAALGAGQVLFFTVLPFHSIVHTDERLAIACVVLLAYGFAARMFVAKADQAPPAESRSALNVASACGSLFVLIELWALLSPMAVAPAWALFALLLMEVGFRTNIASVRLQGHAVAATAFGWLLSANLETGGYSYGLSNRLWSMLVVIAAHYFEWWRQNRWKERLREWERDWKRAYLYTAALLMVVLLDLEFWPEFLAAGWAFLALALLAVGRYRNIADLRLQSYCLAALTFYQALVLELQSPDTVLGAELRVVPGAITIACLFAAQLFIPRSQRARLYYSLLATGLATALLYREVSGRMLTVAWGIEGAVLLGAGFPLRDRTMRLSGMALFLICLGKLFFYDLRQLQTFDRILSFFVLGVILVSVSWLYTRFRDRIQRYL